MEAKGWGGHSLKPYGWVKQFKIDDDAGVNFNVVGRSDPGEESTWWGGWYNHRGGWYCIGGAFTKVHI